MKLSKHASGVIQRAVAATLFRTSKRRLRVLRPRLLWSAVAERVGRAATPLWLGAHCTPGLLQSGRPGLGRDHHPLATRSASTGHRRLTRT